MNTFHRYILILIGLFALIACAKSEDWVRSLPKPWTLSEADITELLPQFHDHYPDFHDRLKAFAIWRVGTPYSIFKLGEEVAPDPDPIIRLDVSDCTAHVLTSLAFVQSDSWEMARERMIMIHYKPDAFGNKTPSYQTRWHYTTDRILNNPATVNITDSLLPRDKLKLVEITLNRQQDGNEFLDLNWTRDVAIRYIPNSEINAELLDKLPEICGVAFVRSSYFEKGIVIGHEGMIIDRKDLIHAGLAAGETQRLNFLDYYFPLDGPIFDGIMIYKFVPLSTEG